MKTTILIPDELFREAKVTAAKLGITLRALITRALERELVQNRFIPGPEPPWRRSFGALQHLREETRRMEEVIHESFEKIDEDFWR